jgi:hypothetical protein
MGATTAFLKRLATRDWREQNIFSAEKMRAFQKNIVRIFISRR